MICIFYETSRMLTTYSIFSVALPLYTKDNLEEKMSIFFTSAANFLVSSSFSCLHPPLPILQNVLYY